MSEKKRFALYIDNDVLNTAAQMQAADNCKSTSEFIEKAIRFYCGYLSAENAMSFLPKVLGSMMEGYLDAMDKHFGNPMAKMALEQSMCNHLIAADSDLTPETLDKLRARCINDLKRTHGQISFKDIWRFQMGE